MTHNEGPKTNDEVPQGSSEVTELLLQWNDGRHEVLQDLLPIVRDELQKLAAGYLRGERQGHTLQPTALVHEVYLRLIDRRRVSWTCRSHFFAFAATTMRRILVEHARSRNAAKRGGGESAVSFDEALGVPDARDDELVALDDALDDLAKLDPRQARVVELRFFGGLKLDEIAAVLEISAATVHRDWITARAWLHRRLRPT